MVRPPTSARLAGAVNVPLQAVCPNAVIAHGQLPSDPLVIGIVLSELGPGPLSHAARGGLLDAAGARQRARPAAVIRGRADGRHAMIEAEGPAREGRRPCPDRFRPVIFITCGSP